MRQHLCGNLFLLISEAKNKGKEREFPSEGVQLRGENCQILLIKDYLKGVLSKHLWLV